MDKRTTNNAVKPDAVKPDAVKPDADNLDADNLDASTDEVLLDVATLVGWLKATVKGWTDDKPISLLVKTGKPNKRYVTLAGLSDGTIKFYAQGKGNTPTIPKGTQVAILLDKLDKAITHEGQLKVSADLWNPVNGKYVMGNAVFLCSSFRCSVLGRVDSNTEHNADVVSRLDSVRIQH